MFFMISDFIIIMQFPEKINHTDTFGEKGIFLRAIIISFLFLLFSSFSLFANTDSTGIKNINGKLFILHKVDPGQGLYGVARRYKTTVSEIQKANQGIGSSLSVGQIILVPCSDKSGHSSIPKESRAQPKPIPKTKEPVKNDVAEADIPTDKDPIYHTITKKETLNIIAANHHLTIAQLKAWNPMLVTLVPGAKMIVGYKERKIVRDEAKPDKNQKTKPTKIDKSKTAKKPVAETIITDKAPDNAVKKAITESGMGTWVDDGSIKSDISLAMHKTAPAGTIVKVTNPMNGKAKYVKVVGLLPDTEENKDIIIKISKNTADDLGIIDKDFRVKLEYSINDTSGN